MVRLQESIKALLQKAGVAEPIDLSVPPKPEMGDVAFACFTAAKQRNKNPAEMAKELEQVLSQQLPKKHVVESVKAFGPYVNFFLRTGVIAEIVISEVVRQGKKYGSNKSGGKKSVIIEYPSNNTHKEFHIGHLRNVCIGNALVQLYHKSGYTTYPVNYLNDFGAHVARCLWGIMKFHAGEKLPQNKQKWLGDVYAEASRYLKEHSEAAAEIAEVQRKLEARDKKLWPLFMKTRQWSIVKFSQLFKELGVRHKAVFFEKDLKKEGQAMVDQLLKSGIATVGEGGAVIIDLTAYKLDIALVRKSDGTGLYLTSDLPLAQKKFKKFKVDESIVITGQEQNFYFKQLYTILGLMGFKKKLTHIGYGLVTLPEGKMSSRMGNVILYEDLRDGVIAHLYSETKQRHPDWPEKKVIATAKTLAMAALKFDMLKHEAAKNIVFNPQEAASLEGFSGPYVLYAVARINSLLQKAKTASRAVSYEVLNQPEEKQLVLMAGNYATIIQNALAEYNPSVIARYCFDLAKAFNDFYNKHPVLSAENTRLIQARLALANSARFILENALDLLTIKPVKEM